MKRLALLALLVVAISNCGGDGDDPGIGTLLAQNTGNTSLFGACGEAFTITRQGEANPVFMTSIGPCQGSPLQLEAGTYNVAVDALGGACQFGGTFQQTVAVFENQTTTFPVGCQACTPCP